MVKSWIKWRLIFKKWFHFCFCGLHMNRTNNYSIWSFPNNYYIPLLFQSLYFSLPVIFFHPQPSLVTPNKLSIPISMLPLDKEFRRMLKLREEGYDPSCRIIIPNCTGVVRVKLGKAFNLPPKDIESSLLLYPQVIFKHPGQFFRELVPNRRYSDPFAEIYIGADNFKTKIHKRTVNPAFNVTCDLPGNINKECTWSKKTRKHSDEAVAGTITSDGTWCEYVGRFWRKS